MDQIKTGGTLLNMKFTPALLEGEEGISRLAQLVRCYFRMDGRHIQFNVVRAETLRAALADPDAHRDILGLSIEELGVELFRLACVGRSEVEPAAQRVVGIVDRSRPVTPWADSEHRAGRRSWRGRPRSGKSDTRAKIDFFR
jgi:hypothetical protein